MPDYLAGAVPNHSHYSTLQCSACPTTALVADDGGWLEIPRGWWTCAVDDPTLESERRIGDTPFVAVWVCSLACKTWMQFRIKDAVRPTAEDIAVILANRWARA